MYSLGKASYGMIGRLLGVSTVAVYKWIRTAALTLPEPEIPGTIQEMELDEMWHFLQSKKENGGCGKRMIVLDAAVLPGWWAVVTLLPFGDYGRK